MSSFEYLGRLIAQLFSSLFGEVQDEPDERSPGSVAGWSAAELDLLITEGRAQLDGQAARYEHLVSRSQFLFTTGLAAIAFSAATFGSTASASGSRGIVATSLWAVGAVVMALSTFGAGALVTVRADFEMVDGTELSNYPAGSVERRLAADYAEMAQLGERTLGNRLVAMRASTALLALGVLLVGGSKVLVLWG
jgi:hypothetical protein